MRAVSRWRIDSPSSRVRLATILRSVSAQADTAATSARSPPKSASSRLVVQNGAVFTTLTAAPLAGMSSTVSMRPKTPSSTFSIEV